MSYLEVLLCSSYLSVLLEWKNLCPHFPWYHLQPRLSHTWHQSKFSGTGHCSLGRAAVEQSQGEQNHEAAKVKGRWGHWTHWTFLKVFLSRRAIHSNASLKLCFNLCLCIFSSCCKEKPTEHQKPQKVSALTHLVLSWRLRLTIVLNATWMTGDWVLRGSYAVAVDLVQVIAWRRDTVALPARQTWAIPLFLPQYQYLIFPKRP